MMIKLISGALIVSSLVGPGALAQSVITPGGATVNAPTGNRTENLSVTNGSRTTLSVGNSTTFGSSVNVSTSVGLHALSRSVLVPSSVVVESKIGDNPLRQTKIDISNLSAKGNGGSVSPTSSSAGPGSSVNVTEGTQYASGNAYIEGMGAGVNMKIDPTQALIGGVPASQATFFTTVHPYNTNKEACSPTPEKSCSFETPTGLVSGNANASANLSTTTNVDINATNFVNTFGQAF